MLHYQLAKNRSQNSEKYFVANQKQFAEFSIFNSEWGASEETLESCSMELRCLCELCERAPACLHRQLVSFPYHSLSHCAPFMYISCAFLPNLSPKVSCRYGGHAQGAARHEGGGWRYRLRSAVELRLHRRLRVLCCSVAIPGRGTAQNIDNAMAQYALVIKQLRRYATDGTFAERLKIPGDVDRSLAAHRTTLLQE